MNKIQGIAKADVIGPGWTKDPGDPATGKPYIRLIFDDGTIVNVTANLLEMLGGVGKGVSERIKDMGL